MRYVLVTTDGRDGSRFEDVEVAQATIPYAQNVPPLLVSEPIEVEEAVFVTLADVRNTDWHPPPRRQLVVMVDGELEIETTDGEKRTLSPGMVALVEDLQGRGHVTTVSSAGPATFMAIPLAEKPSHPVDPSDRSGTAPRSAL